MSGFIPGVQGVSANNTIPGHHRYIIVRGHTQHALHKVCHTTLQRPPYDDKHYISGYNLFVSAYHGFAQLGREHVPVLQPYPLFPISHLQLLQIDSASSSGSVSLRYHLTLQNTDNPARWHVSAKIQLTAPGVGCDPGKMRTYMGIRCSDNVIVFNVPSQGTEDYQVHLRYRLIDVITGYRNNWLGIQSNTNVIL